MRKLSIIIAVFLLISCREKSNPKVDFIDKIINLTIETKSNKFVEFPELYDKLSDEILEEENEKIILVEKLKENGFEISSYGKGNYAPLGPRIINVQMKKKDCECEIEKIYYATISEKYNITTERIKCRNIKN